MAGGGPLGGMYELGALRALEEAISGLAPNRLHVYVGVSSGAFIAALQPLVDGSPTLEIYDATPTAV